MTQGKRIEIIKCSSGYGTPVSSLLNFRSLTPALTNTYGLQGRKSFKSFIPGVLKKIVKPIFTSHYFNTVSNQYRGRVTCLTYHSLTTKRYFGDQFDPNIGIKVHVDCFDAQLDYLTRHSRVITIDEAVNRLSAPRREHGVVLTFDDGYKDFKEYAIPLLEKYKVPATLFLTSNYLSQTSFYWWDELEFHINELRALNIKHPSRELYFESNSLDEISEKYRAFWIIRGWLLQSREEDKRTIIGELRDASRKRFPMEKTALNWEEVREIAKHPLVSIGSHSVSHPNFRLLTPVEKDFELRESKRLLEAELSIPVNTFAFPVGSRDQASTEDFRRVHSAGYQCAFTQRVAHWHKEHLNYLSSLPRIHIDYTDGLERFSWKLSGREALMWSPLTLVVTN